MVAAFDGGQVTSDAGALLLGAANRAIGLVDRLARLLRRRARCRRWSSTRVETMLMQRIFGIALGYEDLVDHDELRHDPVLATLVGKLEAPGAGTARRSPARARLNRLEHAPTCGARPLSQDRPRRRGDRRLVRRPCSWRRTSHRRSGSSSISMPPTIRCTAIRKGASSTATTTATATCRCTCSAAGICWPPSSGARTSMRPPAPSRRSNASWPRSARAGHGSRSCCGPIRALPGTS